MEAKGLKTLVAILETQKSRGWTAHNEFDYFTLCTTCGHWFDCRNPESLIKHQHTAATRIVVTTVTRTSSETISDPAIQFQNATSSPNAAIETPGPPPHTGDVKS
jgi:hypothetical protein